MPPRLLAVALALAATAAGCLSTPADLGAASAAETDAAALLPKTNVIQGDVLASAATPVRTLNIGGAHAHPVAIGPETTGIVIEVEWTPTSPASETLSVWVRPAGTGSAPPGPMDLIPVEPTARAQGAPGLRLALAAEAFPAPGLYDIVVRAAGPAGLVVGQPFTLHVTTFKGIDFDEDFSALG